MIIDARTGRKLHELEGPTEGIEWLCWHPVGDVVVAGSEDFTAWMWNAPQAKCMTVSAGEPLEVPWSGSGSGSGSGHLC